MIEPLPESENNTHPDSTQTPEASIAGIKEDDADDAPSDSSNLFFKRGAREKFDFERLRNLVYADVDRPPEAEPQEKREPVVSKTRLKPIASEPRRRSRFQLWLQYVEKEKREERKRLKEKRKKEEEKRKKAEEEEQKKVASLVEEELPSSKSEESSVESTSSSDSGTSWYDLSSSGQTDSKAKSPQCSDKGEGAGAGAGAGAGGERERERERERGRGSPAPALSPRALRRVFRSPSDFAERARRFRAEVRRRRGQRVWTWEALVAAEPQPLAPALPPPALQERARRRHARYSPDKLHWISKGVRREMREDVRRCEQSLRQLERVRRRRRGRSSSSASPASDGSPRGARSTSPSRAASAAAAAARTDAPSGSDPDAHDAADGASAGASASASAASFKPPCKCVFLKNDSLTDLIRDLRGKAAVSYELESGSSGRSSAMNTTSGEDESKMSIKEQVRKKIHRTKSDINRNPVPQATLLRARLRAEKAAQVLEDSPACGACRAPKDRVAKVGRWKVVKQPAPKPTASHRTLKDFDAVTFGRPSPPPTPSPPPKPERDPAHAKAGKEKAQSEEDADADADGDGEAEKEYGTVPGKQPRPERRRARAPPRHPVPTATEGRARARVLAAEARRARLEEDLRLRISDVGVLQAAGCEDVPAVVEDGDADADADAAPPVRRIGARAGPPGGGGDAARVRVRLPPIAGAARPPGDLGRVRSIFDEQLARREAPSPPAPLADAQMWRSTYPQGRKAREAEAAAPAVAAVQAALAAAKAVQERDAEEGEEGKADAHALSDDTLWPLGRAPPAFVPPPPPLPPPPPALARAARTAASGLAAPRRPPFR